MRYHFLAGICIASLALVANPASAQKREYSPGLNYTTMGANKNKEDGTSASGTQRAEKPKLYNTIEPKKAEIAKPTEDVAEGDDTETTEDAPKEDPTVTIWNKYKDIAAGTAGKKDGEDGDKQATKTITPAKPENSNIYDILLVTP